MAVEVVRLLAMAHSSLVSPHGRPGTGITVSSFPCALCFLLCPLLSLCLSLSPLGPHSGSVHSPPSMATSSCLFPPVGCLLSPFRSSSCLLPSRHCPLSASPCFCHFSCPPSPLPAPLLPAVPLRHTAQQETNHTIAASTSAMKQMSELLRGCSRVCFPGGWSGAGAAAGLGRTHGADYEGLTGTLRWAPWGY